jgi:hypothetical protein
MSSRSSRSTLRPTTARASPAVGLDRAPQEPQTAPVWVIVSLPVYFATALNSARAWSIWSYAYRNVFEDLLLEGANQGRMSVANARITAFSIIEIAEGVPRWFRPTGEVSINQLASLYGEFALRLAGVRGGET